jgi:hypothetical protein
MTPSQYFIQILNSIKTFNHLETDGFFISKIEVKTKTSSSSLASKFQQFEKIGIKFIETSCLLNNEQTLDLQLISNADNRNQSSFLKQDNSDLDTTQLRYIKLENLEAFLKLSEDDNSIHQGENPVIPGLMILQILIQEEHIKTFQNFQIRFLQPLFLQDGFELKVCQNRIEGVNFMGKLFAVKLT